METLIAAVLIALAFSLVASPLVRGVHEPVSDADTEALESAKQAKYREIRDAELDYRSGKLTETEWRTTDDELRREAMQILAQLDGARTTN